MPAHRVHPQGQVTEVSSLSSAKEMPSDLKHKKEQCWPPTRQCLWISCIAFLVLGVLAAVISLGVTFGMPGKPANLPHRQCKTASQQLGFLCEDLTTCLPPSLLCNSKPDCTHGEDESATYCGQMPSSLPQNLIFKCPNQKTWTYVDKVCDTRNDCGDCSDESELAAKMAFKTVLIGVMKTYANRRLYQLRMFLENLKTVISSLEKKIDIRIFWGKGVL
ncbi:low-density lipoprotein receptor class A domain-containing protein 1 isoform X3 [Rhinolophus sinicus]|uniref:low-density lipoprotein receptor class A domain-containing protein 1 isoform X3 n=1 Tax=Rhinolophus sinicus TaxID=89399 RepID=UPI003D7B523E